MYKTQLVLIIHNPYQLTNQSINAVIDVKYAVWQNTEFINVTSVKTVIAAITAVAVRQ